MTKPENRDASRRGNDYGDFGYGVATGAAFPVATIRFTPPNDIHGITHYMRQRQATPACASCVASQRRWQAQRARRPAVYEPGCLEDGRQ